MLKKLSTFVLISLIGVMALAACGSDDDDDPEPTVTRVPATNAPADQAVSPTVAVTVATSPETASPIAATPIAGESSPVSGEATPAPGAPSPIVSPVGTPGSADVSSPTAASPVATEAATVVASPITSPAAASPAATEPVVAETATAQASPVASPAASPAASPGASAPGATALTVTAGDLFFDPKELAGAANTDVVITITNNGALAHDFSLPDLGITSTMLNPGESTTVTVNAPAGSYRFICTVPGHAEAGMVGTLTLS